MRDITFRTLGATAVIVGIAVAAFAQAGSGQPSAIEIVAEPTEATTITTSLENDTVAPTVAEPEPFEYRVGLLSDITTDNFWAYYGRDATSWNAYVLGPTKPALFGIDHAANALVADIALVAEPSRPTWNADGWRVHVTLRDDVRWSDGNLLTASDIEFTFETVRSLGLEGAWAEAYPATITAVVADSDNQLRIEFDRQPGMGEWPYGVGLAPIMARHIWGDVVSGADTADALYEADAKSDVSSGPLQILKREPGRITAIVNHDRVTGSVDSVVFEVFDTEAAAADALADGRIDTILSPHGLSKAVASSLNDIAGVTVEDSPANAVRYLGFNLDRAPMSELAFRTALSLLFDREAVAGEIVPDSQAAFTMVPAANSAWFDQSVADEVASGLAASLEERLSQALAGLVEAGYSWNEPPTVSDGKLVPGAGLLISGQTPAPLTILTPGDKYDPARPEYATRLESTLEVLGFDVRPVITDFETVVDLAFSTPSEGERGYDMYLLGWTLGNPAYPDYFGRLFAVGGHSNNTGYDNAKFSAALSDYRAATDQDEARAALGIMEQRLAEDLPYLVLYHPQITEAYRSDRVQFSLLGVLGGIQARIGGLEDVSLIQ